MGGKDENRLLIPTLGNMSQLIYHVRKNEILGKPKVAVYYCWKNNKNNPEQHEKAVASFQLKKKIKQDHDDA